VLNFAFPSQRIEILETQIQLLDDIVEHCKCLMGQQLLNQPPLIQYRHAPLMEL